MPIQFRSLVRALAIAGGLSVVSAGGAEISFVPSLDAARKADAARPVVIVFGATWCGWCRRLEADTLTDPRVVRLASGYHWVKIDIDEQKEIAARYRVRGVPATLVVDSTDAVVDRHDGYLPADRFAAFLARATAPHPARDPIVEREPELDPDAAALKREWATGDRERVERLVIELTRADRRNRRAILVALDDAGTAPWPWLWHLMQDERLATRAAAAAALDRATRGGLAFHPFAAADRRREQGDAWKRWIEGRGVAIPAWDRTPAADAEIPLADEGPAEAEVPQ